MSKLSLIVAMARNRSIGRDNRLPWRLSHDLQYFKQITWGKPIIMGRKTFDSIGRALPGRTNIVVTRQPQWRAEGTTVAASLDHAIELARAVARADRRDEVMLIGGASLYQAALARADRLYLTQIQADIAGDAFFPPIEMENWHEVKREDYSASGDNPYDYAFVVLERVASDTLSA